MRLGDRETADAPVTRSVFQSFGQDHLCTSWRVPGTSHTVEPRVALCEQDTDIGYKVMRNLAADMSFKLRHRNLSWK